MPRLAVMALVALLLTAPLARAESPFVIGPADAAKAAKPAGDAAPVADEATEVARIKAMFDAGTYDQVIEGAKGFLRNGRDEKLKIEVTRLVADSMRKKGDWKLAPSVYLRLRDRFEKGADEYVRSDAIAEIVRISPAGVYPPCAAAAAGRTLVDDGFLAECLKRVAEVRMERVKPRLQAIKQGRTVQEVLTAFAAVADECRQARVLAAEISPDTEREAAAIASARLAELHRQAIAMLEAKKADFDTAIKTRRLDQMQRKEMERLQATCKELAKAEEAFQAGMGKMSGTDGWAEGGKLISDSTARRTAYETLATALTPPPPTGIGRTWATRSGYGTPGGYGNPGGYGAP